MPVPIDFGSTPDREAELRLCAIQVVYEGFCSGSVEALQSAVVAIIGQPIPGEDDLD